MRYSRLREPAVGESRTLYAGKLALELRDRREATLAESVRVKGVK